MLATQHLEEQLYLQTPQVLIIQLLGILHFNKMWLVSVIQQWVLMLYYTINQTITQLLDFKL
ncbi:hypothetical protein EBT31_21175 [bacterium]|nr:hypothetical protein [bacterium]